MKKHTLLLGISLMLSFTGFTQNWVEFSPCETTKPVHTVSISNDTLVKFNVGPAEKLASINFPHAASLM